MIKNFILPVCFLSIIISSQAQTSPQKFRVEFEGNKNFSSDALLEKLNFCLANFSAASEEEGDGILNYCLQKEVRGFLQSRGYLNATLIKSEERRGDQRVKISVAVEEKLFYRLGEINIQGAEVFTRAQLLEKLNLKTGEAADGQELYRWLFESVKKLYDDNGYIQSDFEIEPKFKTLAGTEKEGIADFNILVSEGQRFSIGRIMFIGNEQTSDRVLRSALLIEEDEFFNQSLLTESVEKLNSLGLFEPIDKDRDVELRTDDETPLLNIRIRVKEKRSL